MLFTNQAAVIERAASNSIDPIVVFDVSENSFLYPSTKNTPKNIGSWASAVLDWRFCISVSTKIEFMYTLAFVVCLRRCRNSK